MTLKWFAVMLNTLFPDIPWNRIKCVGFDLDGTLYDEFDTIQQIYRDILNQQSHFFTDMPATLTFMLNRWLEKGSSYNFIFGETFDRFSNAPLQRDEFIHKALTLFRNYSPVLSLAQRNHHLLGSFRQKFDLFLISDGPPVLQKNKFKTLGLDVFFNPDKTIFTGDHGKDFYKPRVDSFYQLAKTSKWHYSNKEILYFGDRTVDEEFTRNLNILFQKVYNMVPQ